MDRVLYCDCGFEARAADEEGLVAEVQRHALEAHGMRLSGNDVLLLVFRTELDQHVALTIAHETTSHREEKEDT